MPLPTETALASLSQIREMGEFRWIASPTECKVLLKSGRELLWRKRPKPAGPKVKRAAGVVVKKKPLYELIAIDESGV